MKYINFITAGKGGVGKSLLCTALGLSYRSKNRKVAIVETNPTNQTIEKIFSFGETLDLPTGSNHIALEFGANLKFYKKVSVRSEGIQSYTIINSIEPFEDYFMDTDLSLYQMSEFLKTQKDQRLLINNSVYRIWNIWTFSSLFELVDDDEYFNSLTTIVNGLATSGIRVEIFHVFNPHRLPTNELRMTQSDFKKLLSFFVKNEDFYQVKGSDDYLKAEIATGRRLNLEELRRVISGLQFDGYDKYISKLNLLTDALLFQVDRKKMRYSNVLFIPCYYPHFDLYTENVQRQRHANIDNLMEKLTYPQKSDKSYFKVIENFIKNLA
jgi:hypothetical protein